MGHTKYDCGFAFRNIYYFLFFIGSGSDSWNNPAVESLLQNGYSKEMVQKALALFRKRNGG